MATSEQYEALKRRLKRKFRDAKLETGAETEHLRKMFKPVTDPILEQTKQHKLDSEAAAAQRQQQLKELLAIEAGQQHQQEQHGERLRNIQLALETATGGAADEDSDSEIAFNAGARRRHSSSMSALTPRTPRIEAAPYPEDASLLGDVQLGPLATKYLSMFAAREALTDPTFGIRYDPEKKRYMIGAMVVDFAGDDLVVGGKKYEGTDALWQLMMLKNPHKPHDDDPSLRAYHDILGRSKAVYQNNDDSTRRLKSSAGHKYTTFIKPVWGQQKKGEGLKKGNGYRYYRDPNDLCDRLQLLVASRDAGHTDHDQEILHIVAELRRNALLSEAEYGDMVRGYAVCE